MPQKRSTRLPMRTQDSQVRNRNFLEVNLGYAEKEALEEASPQGEGGQALVILANKLLRRIG